METQSFVIGCVIGTRPEVIKMAPIIFALNQCPWADVFLINTAQHRNLLDELLTLFELKPDIDLDSMTAGQSLGQLTGNLCQRMDTLFSDKKIDIMLAIGDTTTVFVASLIAFYHHIPFGHIEAGLRSYNIRQPFPEEINRVLTAPLSNWHFVPTILEKENLLKEGIDNSKIIVTGNPVIDALYWVLENKADVNSFYDLSNIIIVTMHRRENFGQNIQDVCEAIIALSELFQEINFVLPVHPNPGVQNDIRKLLDHRERIYLLSPLRYDEFAHLMNRSILILTDSGGIQEEAPALKKPVLVLRNLTERPAIITEGVGKLIGTNTENIIKEVSELLTNKELYNQMAKGVSPYGDGHSAERIVRCLYQSLTNSSVI